MAFIDKLGNYIEKLERPNTELRYGVDDVCGITNTKQLVLGTKANLIGRTFEKFSILAPREFIYNRRTSRNGERISLGYNTTDREWILTEDYCHFRIRKDKENILDPDVLYLFFLDPEFDRYARFNSWGSATEFFNWEDMIETPIPILPINEQRKIVHDYQNFIKRIAVLQKINETLEAVAATYFCDSFSKYGDIKTLPDGWRLAKLSDLCDVRGGKRLPADSELSDLPTKHPYIRVRDISNDRYVCLTDQFQYIDDDTYKEISRYTVNTGDLVISIVGTIGLIGKIHRSLDGANLTENCVKLTSIHSVSSDYLYYTLQYKKQNKEIDLLTVGAVQAKLPIYNIQSMKILVPPAEVLKEFQNIIEAINQTVEANMLEIQKMKQLATLLLSNITEGA
ncbi:MAG: restriction endonuclease subunit S [Clostridia bacterium]|nr:restriction endonuclease subunit S [Clostridia bacterium]